MAVGKSYQEKELLSRIVHDDAAAFATIFHHYFHHIYTLMFRYTNSHSEAEDITQQVFVKAWEKRKTFPEIDQFDKWLFTVALNEFRGRFRKLRTEAQYRQYLKETFAEEQGSPEDFLIYKQKTALLKQAIDGLSPNQRQAFLLSREEGLTYAEISGKMGIEPATVKEHIARALKSIRLFVKSQGNAMILLAICHLLSFFCWLSPAFHFHASSYRNIGQNHTINHDQK